MDPERRGSWPWDTFMRSTLYKRQSHPDLTVARLETAKISGWLALAYLGHDHLGSLPGDNLQRALGAGRQKAGLISGCDANAHHTVWDSTDINDRVQTSRHLYRTISMTCLSGKAVGETNGSIPLRRNS